MSSKGLSKRHSSAASQSLADEAFMSHAFGAVLAQNANGSVTSGGRHVPTSQGPIAELSASDVLFLARTSGSSSRSAPDSRARSLMNKLFGKGGWLIPDFRRVARAATLAVALQNAMIPQAAWAMSFTELVDGWEVYDEVVVSKGGDWGGDVQTVTNNGGALNGFISQGGMQIVENGGYTANIVVDDGGLQYVMDTAETWDTTVSNYGSQVVSTGGAAYRTQLSGDYIFDESTWATQIVDGGFASGTVVNANGLQVVDNGLAQNTVVWTNGNMRVTNSGVVLNTVLSGTAGWWERATMEVDNGGYASGTTVGTYGVQTVSGGSVTNTNIYMSGAQGIGSGAQATNTIIHSGGSQTVLDGGVASGTTITTGRQYVVNGGSALNTVLHGESYQILSAGGSASGTVVNASAWQSVSGGGTVVVNTTINSGGFQTLNNSGFASGTVVHGAQMVGTNASATDTAVSSGGTQFVWMDGTVTDTRVYDGGVQHLAGAASGTIIYSGGVQNVHSFASGTTVEDGGLQAVQYGGSAVDTTVSGGGRQEIFYFGSAVSTFLEAGAQQHIFNGGVAAVTTVSSGGQQHISSGGVAIDTTILSSGQQHLHSGASADGVELNGGFQYVYGGAVATSTTVNSNGAQYVEGLAEDTTVNAYGLQRVYDGGLATGAAVNRFGMQVLHSGASSEDTDLTGDGEQVVSSGAVAARTWIAGDGRQFITDGGLATGTIIDSGGIQQVQSGGSASGTTVNEGGRQQIFEGFADDTTLNDGGQQMIWGGSVTNTVVNDWSYQAIYEGTATGTIINANGTQHVGSDGLATDTAVNSGGYQQVEGIATNTTIDGGVQYVDVGGLATNTTINSGGVQRVYDGTATSSVINDGGWQSVFGGLATDTTVNSGGWQYVEKSTVENTTVHSGGVLWAAADANLGGADNIIHEGGVLDAADLELLVGAWLTLERETDAMQGTNFTGDGGLIKTGDGTLYVTGVNTYTGGTHVMGGLLVGNTDSLHGDIELYDNDTGVVFDQSFDGDYSGQISGTGSLAKFGSGTVTLLDVSPFTGAVVVNAGTLALGPGASIPNATSLTLGAGATFDYGQAAAYVGATPPALKDVFIGGLGTTIVTAGDVADFTDATLTFVMPHTAMSGDVFLTVLGDADLTGATVNLYTPTGRPNVKSGDRIVLVDATGELDSDVESVTVVSASGDTYTVEISDEQFFITLVDAAPDGPTYTRMKAYSMSRIAQVAFLDQGLDLLLHQGFKTAQAATDGPGIQVASFGGVGGNWSRYTTGSHVDVVGLSMLLGVAAGTDVGGEPNAPAGRATGGVFFETGQGSYKSRDDFPGLLRVRGQGDLAYYGGGLMGRYDVMQGPLAGLYGETSVRAGWSSIDFRTDDIQYNGWRARFDSSAVYYGAHIGAGHMSNLNDKATLHLSGKLLWTHLDSDSLTVYRDQVRFRSADSLRLRLGGRVSYAVSEVVSPYVGAYWEYAFDGSQRTTINDVHIVTPTLRGHTGIGEIGVTVTPSKKWPVSIDLGVQGHAGRRDGITGSLQVRVEF